MATKKADSIKVIGKKTLKARLCSGGDDTFDCESAAQNEYIIKYGSEGFRLKVCLCEDCGEQMPEPVED